MLIVIDFTHLVCPSIAEASKATGLFVLDFFHVVCPSVAECQQVRLGAPLAIRVVTLARELEKVMAPWLVEGPPEREGFTSIWRHTEWGSIFKPRASEEDGVFFSATRSGIKILTSIWTFMKRGLSDRNVSVSVCVLAGAKSQSF